MNKALIILFLIIVFNLLSFSSWADGVITNGTKVRVHRGTYFVESGNRTIQNGAFFNIWGSASILGNLSNLGNQNNLVIESDAGGTGSLIYNNGNPLATVERYLEDGMWHLLVAPTNNVVAQQYYFNNNPMVWLKKYVESIDDYQYLTSLSTPMPSGKGFAYWIEQSKSDVIVEVSGTLNADNFTLNSSSNPAIQWTDIDHGFNLIGNPYASSILLDFGSWTFNNLEETVWVYDPTSGTFKTRNSGGLGDLPDNIIPSSQGFFVKALSAGASISIPTSAKRHNSNYYYKSENDFIDELEYIIFHIEKENNENLRDECWIGFHELASNGFDNGIDISKRKGDEEAVQLFFTENNDDLFADILPPLENQTKIVQMNFEAPSNGTYILDLLHISAFANQQILVEDLVTGYIYDLEENPIYILEASTNDESHRFNIHFNPISTSISENEGANWSIYSFDEIIYLNFLDPLKNVSKKLEIFNNQGKLIYAETLPMVSSHQINLNIPTQIIYLKIDSPNYQITKKLFLK